MVLTFHNKSDSDWFYKSLRYVDNKVRDLSPESRSTIFVGKLGGVKRERKKMTSFMIKMRMIISCVNNHFIKAHTAKIQVQPDYPVLHSLLALADVADSCVLGAVMSVHIHFVLKIKN